MQEHLIPASIDKEPVEFADAQLKIFWLPTEIKVEKDIQDLRVNFTEAEKHGVITTLKLFSIYETHAGDEFWGKRYKEVFPSFDYHRMASVFSMFELAIHAPFYKKINELLYLDNKEFYLQYLQNEKLKERVDYLNKYINDPNPAVALAVFSMVEGAILYSSFAFLRHFQ